MVFELEEIVGEETKQGEEPTLPLILRLAVKDGAGSLC